MREVLVVMVCIFLLSAAFGCVRQVVNPPPAPAGFIDDGNGKYVADIRQACYDAMYDALLKDTELAKELTVSDLEAAHNKCVQDAGVRAI